MNCVIESRIHPPSDLIPVFIQKDWLSLLERRKKQEVMENLKELRGASEDKIRKVSIAHDLTWRQRERVKEVRMKALQELEDESREKEDTSMSENFRVIVVGQQTMNPRALRVRINRM